MVEIRYWTLQRSLVVLLLTLGSAAPLRAEKVSAPLCAPPEVLVLLDQSGSMQHLLAPKDKWAAAKQAIVAMTAAYQTKAMFGLSTFPADGNCDAQRESLDADGALFLAPALQVGDDQQGSTQAAKFQDALAFTPQGQTPLVQTLKLAQVWYQANPLPERRRFLVLVTDGQESGCGTADEVVLSALRDAAQGIRDAGVERIYVIGFGKSVKAQQLNVIALVGGTAKTNCQATTQCVHDKPLLNDGDCALAAGICYFQTDEPINLSQSLKFVGNQVATESCDGKDNDCDGVVDNGATCEAGSVCACGSCQPLAVNGECLNGVKVDAVCVVDNCGAGTQCNLQTLTCDPLVPPGQSAAPTASPGEAQSKDPTQDQLASLPQPNKSPLGSAAPVGTEPTSSAATGCVASVAGDSSHRWFWFFVCSLAAAFLSRRRKFGGA